VPVPQRLFGRDLFTLLTATGLMGKDARLADRPEDARPRDARRLERAAARKRGIVIHGRTAGAGRSSVRFGDGPGLEVRTVISATGFSVDHSWIDVPVLGGDGALVHARGVTAPPGIYVLGMPWQHARGSALLGWVAEDARHIAGHIAAHHSRRPSAPERAMIRP
jgi:putative flavoprotein involved in K+ transport